MSLLQDKASFIKAHGDPITIIRPGGNISTYARFVKGRQLLSPYEINFVRFMLFLTDSSIQRGDLAQNVTTSEQYLVAGVEDRTLNGVLSGVYTELYVVNYPSVQVQRLSTGYDENGNPLPSTWNPIATLPMNVEHVNGNVPYKDGLLLQDTTFRIMCQTSTNLEISPNPDRIVIDGKNYEVNDINLSIVPGLQVVQVKVDNRT